MRNPRGHFLRHRPRNPISWSLIFAVIFLTGMVLQSSTAIGASDDASLVAPDWPDFRGPHADGHASEPGDEGGRALPLHWSETENVAWKTEIPHSGWSSPVVMDDRIWLTTATTDGRELFVLCLDADSGEILFTKKVFHTDEPEPLANNVNGYASPSPVLEAGRLYVHFGSYGTACLDTETAEVLWERRDLPCRHYRGPGSSPVLFDGLLILSMDGVDMQYMVALDKKTGETVWKSDRPTVWTDFDAQGRIIREGDLRKAYSTPIVYEVDGKPQMITVSSMCAYAYDPLTGREIWRATLPGFTPAARPVYGHGHVFIGTGRRPPEMWAIRVDGTGDVTDTHVSWKAGERVAPQEPSPLLIGDLLYMVSNEGIATCLEADTGEEVWSERIGGNYMASPIYADGRIYAFSVQGKGVVFREGRTFELLAESRLDSGFRASPAVLGNALLLRSKTHLYRIESRTDEAE